MSDVDFPRSKLLVRTLNSNKKECGVQFNFNLIDVKEREIKICYIPSVNLMEGAAIGKMVAMLESESESESESASESDSGIYIFGCPLNPTKLPAIVVDKDEIHFHRFSSKYSLLRKRWFDFNFPVERNFLPIPATMLGKLYCFGVPWRRPMVYENDYGWKDLELPDHLINRKVSFPIIPDPMQNRFLVHFFDSHAIYAFYPNSNTWECVVDHFSIQWSPPMALSGNLLFFYVFNLPHLVIAYDISTQKWLHNVGNVHPDSATLPFVDDMFIFPENPDVLCLASGHRRTDANHAPVDILRLRFNHIIGSNHLILTALDHQTYDIPTPSTVHDFLVV